MWKLLESKKIRQLKTLVAAHPEDVEARFNLGTAYEEKGQRGKAIREFEEALRLNPKSAETEFNLGILYEKVNDGKRAIFHTLKAGNLFGERADVHNKERARKKLRELYQKFGFKQEDIEEIENQG